jgi:hypothetical protein
MEPGKTKEEKIEYFLRKTPRQVGFENEEEQLQKDMSLLIPANMQGKLTLEEALVKLDTANPYNEIKSGIEELEAVSACIAAAIYVARAKKIIFHNMVSTSECGKMIGKKPDIIRQKCLRGTMEGATKIGIMWYIPVDSLYVQKNRKKDYSG